MGDGAPGARREPEWSGSERVDGGSARRDPRGAHPRGLARRQLLVAGGRPAHVGPLRRGRRARGARHAGAPRARHDALVLLLARFRPRAGPHRRGRRRPVRGLPRRPPRDRAGDDPDGPRRPHVRRELGPPVARGPRPVPRRVARRAAGVARRGARVPLRPPPGGRRLARLERDAALRRPGDVGRDHRVGAARRPGAACGRCDPARLARRRRLGDRDDGRRQRLLAARARAARGLPRAALVPDGGRRGAPGARARVRLRARRRVRQARRPRGVRRDLRLRGRRPRRRHLPAGPAHDAPRRSDRVARLVERGLRRPQR